MISKTIDITDINDYIIEQLSILFKKSESESKSKSNPKSQKETKANMDKFEHITWCKLFGTVSFKKQLGDAFINIYFRDCRFGYDFYNQNGPSDCAEIDVDECCVCYENTDNKIMCGHRLCVGCVNDIMKHSKTMDCPLCRKKHETSEGLEIKYPAHLMWLLFG